MKNRLLMILFSLFLVFGFIVECNDKSIFSVDSIRYLEDQSLSDKNDALLSKVDRLEKLAEAYIMEREIPASKVELCMQYIRKDRYSTEKWIGLLGPIDADFIEYVEKEDGALVFSNSEVLYDLKTSRPIDFVHMIATLNSYVRYGDNIPLIIMPISTHYAGWAGDLLTFLEEVTNYRINNNIEDVNVYQTYVDSLLGTNKISTMSSVDVLADFDAYNISHDATLNVKNGLYSALNRYYKTFDSYSSVGNRFEVIKSLFGSSEDVISGYVDPYLTQLTIRKLFIPDTTDKVTDLDLQVVKRSFSKYILGNVYFEFDSDVTTATVGEEVKVKVIESNLDKARVTVTPEIAEAKFSGDYLVVNPKKEGDVTITLSSLDGTISKDYKISIVNVPPEIVAGLDSNYYLHSDESQRLSIEAKGTNNIYTWYIGDSANGDFSVLAETSNSSYVLMPTKEMDGKYIKCGVKNNGNPEVFTNATVIFVSKSGVSVIKKNGGTIIIVLLVVVVLAIVGVIVYIKFFKGRRKKVKDEQSILPVEQVVNNVEPQVGVQEQTVTPQQTVMPQQVQQSVPVQPANSPVNLGDLSSNNPFSIDQSHTNNGNKFFKDF